MAVKIIKPAKRKRASPGVDKFVLYAWARCKPETRAMLVRDNETGELSGDFAARAFAYTIRDLFSSPQDFKSFCDELRRLS
jgi:hypothetical protein